MMPKTAAKPPAQPTWDGAERGAWHVPPPVKPSEWAQRHRGLTRSSIPGPWRNDNAPYLRLLMDLCAAPGVVQLNIEKGAQTGGSEALRNVLGYWAHTDPGPVGLTLPDRTKGRKIVKRDVRPVFYRTRCLR